ncbi:DUF3488 and transglutaminase-like domain-containing protein [Bifidobacterium thermophilum]|uniref:DUF3488 and transglutaminase-like domain-containing protein n=1 Tax=Bifidobacterium thermophilum TaxID=33905 RepID=UPI0030A7DDC4
MSTDMNTADADFTGTTGLGVTSTVTSTSTETGTWADATHSAIWISRDTGKPPLPSARRPHAAQAASLLVAAVLTLLAASNLIDVYGSALLWAAAAIPATLIGSLIAFAGLIPALRLWWQILFMALAQLVVGPVLILNDTTIAHVIPTVRTLRQGWTRMLGSFKYLLAVDPPTGTGDGSLLAVWTICLWAALLTGIVAVARDGRLTMLAVIPVAADLAVCALLGSQTGFQRIAVGTVTAIVLVVWIGARWNLLELGRWLSTAIIMLLAASLAVGGCLMVGQHRTILRDHYEPPLSPYEYSSPLSGMRSYIKNHKDDVLLTVTDLPAGSTVRLAVMDRFDGNVWNLSDTAMAADSSSYRRVGTSIRNTAQGKRFTAAFTVDDGLDDYWLPLAGAASSVTFSKASDADSFYYNTDTMSSIYPARTRAGLSYTETGVIPDTPTDKEIAKAAASRISQPKAEDVPDSVDKLATAIAGGQAGGGEAAQALADKLKETGWFSHGLSGDYPSNAGHGNYRIDQLLAGSAMVGDSEQYASAMALMARSLGLPSRVVLGFVPKNDEGDISDSRTRKHGGRTVTEFTGNDVTAWVEIRLDGYGWVAFYPTPKETKVPDENQNLTPPNPKTLVRQPPVPLTDPLRDDNQATSKSSIGGSMADEPPRNASWQRAVRIIRAVAIYGSPLWVLLIVVALLLAIKAVALTRSRRHGSASQRVAAGWQAVTALALQSGLDIRGTRSEQAQAIATQMGLDSGVLGTLGRQADYVSFSGRPVDAGQAEQYWRDVLKERGIMLKSMPLLRRWRARLSLAGVFHARGGTRKGRDS